MDNSTTANKAAVGAGLGSLAIWALSVLLPATVLETQPLPNEAIVVIVTWLFCRFVPAGASVAGVS